MPISVANTTLSLSQIDQLREIVSQTNNILGTTIEPFTVQTLNKSEWWQYEYSRQLVSQSLVEEGYDALPAFTISDLNNGELPITLINYINVSLQGGEVVSPYLLESTGAVEAFIDGLQRFTYDGVSTVSIPSESNNIVASAWYAEIPANKRLAEYVITLTMPDVVVLGGVNILIASKNFEPIDLLATTATKYIKLEVKETEGNMALILEDTTTPANSVTVFLPSPAQGDLIRLTLGSNGFSYTSGSTTETITLPSGFFVANPNVIITSAGEATVSTVSAIVQPNLPI